MPVFIYKHFMKVYNKRVTIYLFIMPMLPNFRNLPEGKLLQVIKTIQSFYELGLYFYLFIFLFFKLNDR